MCFYAYVKYFFKKCIKIFYNLIINKFIIYSIYRFAKNTFYAPVSTTEQKW